MFFSWATPIQKKSSFREHIQDKIRSSD